MPTSAFTKDALQELHNDRNLLWRAEERRLCLTALADLNAGKNEVAVREELTKAILASGVPLLDTFMKETGLLYLDLFVVESRAPGPAIRRATRMLLWEMCAETFLAQTQLQPSAPKESPARRQQEYKLMLHQLGVLVEDLYWQFAAMHRFWDEPHQSLLDMLVYWRGFLRDYLSAFYQLAPAEAAALQELLDPQTEDRQFLELLEQHGQDFANRVGIWHMFPSAGRYNGTHTVSK